MARLFSNSFDSMVTSQKSLRYTDMPCMRVSNFDYVKYVGFKILNLQSIPTSLKFPATIPFHLDDHRGTSYDIATIRFHLSFSESQNSISVHSFVMTFHLFLSSILLAPFTVPCKILAHLIAYLMFINLCPFSLPFGVRDWLPLVIKTLPGCFY